MLSKECTNKIPQYFCYSICRGDDLSGERWHCTSDTCDRGCIQDGRFYPVGSSIFEENLTWLVALKTRFNNKTGKLINPVLVIFHLPNICECIPNLNCFCF